jgi:hypothetical protein
MLNFRDRRQAAIVFVSHNLGALELMCPRSIWLDRGSVCADGATSAVLRAYLDAADDGTAGEDTGSLQVDSVEVRDSRGVRTDRLSGKEPFTVRVAGRAHRDLDEPVFVVTVRGDHGPLFAGNMHIDGNWPTCLERGPFLVDCAFDAPGLKPGRYRVELKVKQNVRTNYYEPRVMAHFVVPGDVVSGAGGADVPYCIMSNR